MFIPQFVCLSACLFAGSLKKLRTDFDEIFWRVGRGPSNSRLDFTGDLDHDPD